MSIRYGPAGLNKGKESALAAVESNSWALECVQEDWRKDRDVVLAAVKEDGTTLLYAHDDFRPDWEVVKLAVEQDRSGWEFIRTKLTLPYDVVVRAALVETKEAARELLDRLSRLRTEEAEARVIDEATALIHSNFESSELV
jgi:hypothetical protein